ncbi:recombinase family protein [Nonomuraea sp. NPDC050310]|uniref:recombinase family protein n=1 Tax=Nonomuraea sp. NPDC050310 TaxID=3154935 RepID=UPI0033FA377A
MTRRAAIYCRISQDREGAGLGVARQEADCRKLVELRGWNVAGVYPDNDVSAYSGSPAPPGNSSWKTSSQARSTRSSAGMWTG